MERTPRLCFGTPRQIQWDCGTTIRPTGHNPRFSVNQRENYTSASWMPIFGHSRCKVNGRSCCRRADSAPRRGLLASSFGTPALVVDILILGFWIQGRIFPSFREFERRRVTLGLRWVNVDVDVNMSRGHAFL